MKGNLNYTNEAFTFDICSILTGKWYSLLIVEWLIRAKTKIILFQKNTYTYIFFNLNYSLDFTANLSENCQVI